MLVYIHFPFCRTRCKYCAFYSKIYDAQLVEAFVRHLKQECRFWGERLQRPAFVTLYFGGGTPSLLSLQQVEEIVECVENNFSWPQALEFSFEVNPDSVSLSYLKGLLALGVNRLSIGIQSLDDNLLQVLGRRHDCKQALEACLLAREAGFSNVSADLIWSLPGQTLPVWLETLKTVQNLGLTHLSCYALTVEPRTPLERELNQGDLILPGERLQGQMFLQGADFLEEHGFLHYEISNFARMGFFCQHNQGYWQGMDYLGLGPAAVSTMGGYRWENPSHLESYFDAVELGKLGNRPEVLDQETRRREFLMLSLRTVRGLDLKEYRRRTGQDFFKQYSKIIKVLRQHNLIRITKDFLRLSRPGMLVSDAILANFF